MHTLLHQMASDVMIAADMAEFRRLLLALLDGERANWKCALSLFVYPDYG